MILQKMHNTHTPQKGQKYNGTYTHQKCNCQIQLIQTCFFLMTGQKLTQATEAAVVTRNIEEIATSLTDFDAILGSDDIGKVS